MRLSLGETLANWLLVLVLYIPQQN